MMEQLNNVWSFCFFSGIVMIATPMDLIAIML